MKIQHLPPLYEKLQKIHIILKKDLSLISSSANRSIETQEEQQIEVLQQLKTEQMETRYRSIDPTTYAPILLLILIHEN